MSLFHLCHVSCLHIIAFPWICIMYASINYMNHCNYCKYTVILLNYWEKNYDGPVFWMWKNPGVFSMNRNHDCEFFFQFCVEKLSISMWSFVMWWVYLVLSMCQSSCLVSFFWIKNDQIIIKRFRSSFVHLVWRTLYGLGVFHKELWLLLVMRRAHK